MTAPIVLNQIADRTAILGQSYSFTVPANTFSDADGDTLTYTAQLADGAAWPLWLTFNPLTRTFSGKPANDDMGTLNIILTASDGVNRVSDNFLLTAALTGPQTKVNSFVASTQQNSSVDKLADGGWIVTWASNTNDTSGYGIYQQRYNADGTTHGSEAKVSTFIMNDQSFPAVAAFAGGGWVVSWQSWLQDGSGWGIYQQRYSSIGTKIGDETRVNATTPGSQSTSSITALADGGWVVSWETPDNGGIEGGIYQQRYSSVGTTIGGESRVNTFVAGVQSDSSINALTDGGWIVIWTSSAHDGSSLGIYQQRYNSDGSPSGSETLVNSYTTDAQISPSATGLSDGGWVVTWGSYLQDGSGIGIYQQRYGENGLKGGREIRVNTTTADHQQNPSIAALDNGGWVVVWQSTLQDGSGQGIYAQSYRADGSRAGGELLVNTFTTNDQLSPSVAALDYGKFVVTWHGNGLGDGEGVFQKTFTFADEAPQGNDKTITFDEDTSYRLTEADFGYFDFNGHLFDSVTVTSLPAAGSLKLGNTNVTVGQVIFTNQFIELVFTPPANASGDFMFSFKVKDEVGALDAMANTIKFHVNPINDAPVLTGASAVLADGAEDTKYTFSAAALLAGYTDPEGDAMNVSNLTSSNGTVVDNGNGTLTLMPAANFNGVVTLNYKVSDGSGKFTLASNSFSLDAVNDAPVLTGPTANLPSGTEDKSYLITASALLAGYTDVDGDPLSISGLATASGTLISNGNGTWTLKPADNFNGNLQLTYDIIDGNGASVPGTVSITFAAEDDPATITGTANTNIGEDQAGTVGGKLTLNDVDTGEAEFQPPASLAGQYGAFTFNRITGVWTYDVDSSLTAVQAIPAGSTLLDTLDVTSKDGTTTQKITVTINGADDAAVITGVKTASIGEEYPGTVGGTLLVKDVDTGENGFLPPGPDSLPGSYGMFAFNATTGAWTYDLNNTSNVIQSLAAGATLEDTYKISTKDGTGEVITVSITGANDVAGITGISAATIGEDQEGSVNGVLAISDIDTGEAMFQSPALLEGAFGAFTFDGSTGLWIYKVDSSLNAVQSLAAGTTGTDTLNVVSKDGSATKSIAVTINGANDAPVLSGSKAVLANGVENVAYTFTMADLLLGYSDVDNGDILSIANLTASRGTLINNNGTWTLVQDGDVDGLITLNYNVIDGNGGVTAAFNSFKLDVVSNPPNTITFKEDSFYTFSSGDFGFSSVDDLSSVTIETVEGRGELMLNGVTVNAGQKSPLRSLKT